ncbi:methyltransferase family protein [Rhizobacter sp. LjRoot28]|jgi:protein-S-isoprenylcysteine O-methyltransferase Ste14|uniref:methyltransferase family protein n=1 Tax=Rhizobacter sp. LjRoot28 TaxID=3342309 RepID=UPI003ECE55E1
MAFLDHRIPPPLVGVAVAAGMWAAAGVGPALPLANGLRYGLIALLVAAGLAFDLSGLRAFRTKRTTVNPLRPERVSAMVTDGVYRWSRNPMYVGMVLFLLAWGVYLSALLPFLGPLAFMVYITVFQIRPEERALRERFGSEFDDYAARVRRWL